MWRNSLVDITKRAGKRAGPPQLQKILKNVVSDSRIAQPAMHSSKTSLFSRTSDALRASRNDAENQMKSSVLHSSMTKGKPLLRAADDNDALLRQAERLPFLYAQEAFCALMKAGEIHLALQLVSFWHKAKQTNLGLSRRKASKELRATIRTLEELKDATTLKAFIDIVNGSLKEQLFAEKNRMHSAALTPTHRCLPHVQNKLFAPLGIARTSDVLVRAVEAACRLTKEDGMSAFDKVLLVEQCAINSLSAIIPTGTPRLAFPLYRQIQSLQSKENIDDEFIKQVSPELVAKLVHPSHYRTIDILAMSIRESRYIDDNWKEKDICRTSSTKYNTASAGWQRLMHHVLPHSPALQSVEENALLISLIAHHRKHSSSSNDQTRKFLRARVIDLLKSPEQAVRRFVASRLLKSKHLVKELKISPVEVASMYAQSFYSRESVDPSLCTICCAAAHRLCRKGRYQEAARLAWNHLSVQSPATKKVFRASPATVDFCVLSMSRAMRDAAASGGGRKWMGYRSLALLRLAAASGGTVTALHCVPVCVNAMECGVPFAAINEALTDIFRSDPALKSWALNLVRLCSETETVPLRLQPARHGIAAEFRKLLKSVCGAGGASQKELLVRNPSRSKQLALWETINGQNNNPRLKALMWAAFLSESIRSEILNCSFLTKSPPAAQSADFQKSVPPSVNDMWNWEVAASIAANCTSPECYQSFLKCLKKRQPKLAGVDTSEMDTVSALLICELDMHDPGLTKHTATEK